MTDNARIQAVSVNHNSSLYMELMVRSLYAKHSPNLSLSLTLYDNASQDDTKDLEALAKRRGIPFIQSGFSTRTANNSHGEILRRFVLEHQQCDYYLFLDADTCFIQDNTIDIMMEELSKDGAAFGIGPCLSWDGLTELPGEYNIVRLHPCCALVRNTVLFRRAVTEVGLSSLKYLWAEKEEYWDTFELMTKVMRIHGFHHRISSAMAIHAFCVSYEWDPPHMMEEKARRRDALLAKYKRRTGDGALDCP